MSDIQNPRPRRRRWWLLISVACLLLIVGGVVFGLKNNDQPEPALVSASSAEVHQFCGACHKYPPPDIYPRSQWAIEVRRGFQFFDKSDLAIAKPTFESVLKYYESLAPDELPPADIRRASSPSPVVFEKTNWPHLPCLHEMNISNVNLVHLFDDKRLDILASDMSTGQILAFRPYVASPSWMVLATLRNPGHVEVIDLDGDGVKDLIVADLGSPNANDVPRGRVVWLRGNKDGTFASHTLLENVGRVADVQPAQFYGSGKWDLVVAEFGWLELGSIRVLENRTTDWSEPEFVSHVVDPRHGSIHVPVTDLNGDGKPDFIALISQEFETVEAYINEGGGRFHRETIYTAPHPAYGSSGIQLVDMNGDGRIDVLYTNGDILDTAILKPYHGVQWLENPGNGVFPWKHQQIAAMYGAHRAVGVDVDDDGLMDVMAVSFLPRALFQKRQDLGLDSVVLFHQKAPGEFERHVLSRGDCDHVSCVAGDLFGAGRQDLVVGDFPLYGERTEPVTVWRNLGKRKKSAKSDR